MSFGRRRQRRRNVRNKGNQVFFVARKALLISTVACTLSCWIPFQADAFPFFADHEGEDHYSTWETLKALRNRNPIQYECPDCEQTYRIAFLGTSITYYNDLPNILGKLFELAGFGFEETNVLRSGASLVAQWERTQNSVGFWSQFCPYLMAGGTATFNDIVKGDWDFIILQDSTQQPARPDKLLESLKVLQTGYAPALAKAQITPVLFQTWAYAEEGVFNSEDLGNFTEFWSAAREGLELYKEVMNQIFGIANRPGDNPANCLRGSESTDEQSEPLQTHMAPIGQAFANFRLTNPEMFQKLYRTDRFHPSAHGTLLSAYILFWTITGGEIAPPSTHLPQAWWISWRFIRHPPNFDVIAPNEEDSKVLWKAAKESYCDYYAEEQSASSKCRYNPLL